MKNTIATEVSLKTRADYKAAIEQCLAEMQRLHEQMARDQEDIDRLQVETKALWPRCKQLEPQSCSSSCMLGPAVGHAIARCPEAKAEQRSSGRSCVR